MNLRKRLIFWLFEKSQKVYTSMFKSHKAWDITKNQLLKLPENTLGYALGTFLNINGFELLPKVERHDAYHVISGYSTKVEDEIALQCLCFGNGKRSLYLLGAIILGVIILPDYYKYYYKSYLIGKRAHSFHHYDYKRLLLIDLNEFRSIIFTKEQQYELNII